MEHVEGEIWTEKNKTWTIKNGIKRTHTKFDQVRKDILEPLACPECGKKMKHRNDTIMWNHHKKCFDCVAAYETELMRLGEFDNYQNKKIIANMERYIAELGLYAENYELENTNSSYVTEDGDIEEWVGGLKKEDVDVIISPQIKKLKETLKDHKDGTTNT